MADNTHVQPTQESLQEETEKLLAELDKEETPTETPEEEVVEKTEEESPEETVEEVEEEETPEEKAEEKPAEIKDETKPEEKKEQTTEDRYRESTKEAQRLYRNNAKMNQAIEDANNLPEPTEEELKTENPEWDEMSDVEKRLAKKAFINDRFRGYINQASQEQRSIDQWVDKIGKFIDDPITLNDFPDLDGKQEKFRQYAEDKKLVGTDFTVLVKAFLHDQSKLKVKHTGKMLETGQGGDKKPMKPKDDKLSVEESAQLRETNYAKYVELLKSGKISTSVE